MTPASTSPPTERVIFVEGVTDKHVVRHICIRNEIPLSFDIEETGGVQHLLGRMENEIKVSDREVVAFVLDANGDIVNQWDRVHDCLKEAGVTPPEGLASEGIIIAAKPGKPRVGVWLMPDNASPGELEDFVQKMIPERDPVWPFSKKYIADTKAHRKFKPQKTSRAELYAWLATRETPGKIGPAIRTRDLDTSGDLCFRFSEWIRELFG